MTADRAGDVVTVDLAAIRAELDEREGQMNLYPEQYTVYEFARIATAREMADLIERQAAALEDVRTLTGRPTLGRVARETISAVLARHGLDQP